MVHLNPTAFRDLAGWNLVFQFYLDRDCKVELYEWQQLITEPTISGVSIPILMCNAYPDEVYSWIVYLRFKRSDMKDTFLNRITISFNVPWLKAEILNRKNKYYPHSVIPVKISFIKTKEAMGQLECDNGYDGDLHYFEVKGKIRFIVSGVGTLYGVD